MKRWLIIGLFLLPALAACVKDPEPVEGPTRKETFSSELSAIDSLMWQRPDSALACLLPYFDTCCAAEHDSHYAHLLLSELLYKNDYAQTNRAELQDAVVYFDSLAQNDNAHTRRSHCGLDPQSPSQKDILAFLAARAHYIYGVGYYEQDSAVPACREYLKALEIMEERFAEKELVGKKAQFMALTHSHLTTLFSDHYMHDQAVYFGESALDYYDKYGSSPRHKAWILNEIGLHYDIMENYDSAYFYYCEGLSVLKDTNNLTYRDIATHLAYLSYKKTGEIDTPLDQLHNLIVLSGSEKEYLSRCLTIGEIYYHEKLYDSALVFLNKVFSGNSSLASKKQAAEWLVEICQIQGKDSEILEYAEFLVPYATQDENQSHVKSQLTKLHQNYVHDKIELRHKLQTRKLLKIAGITLLAILLFALVSAIFHFINKNRYLYLKRQKDETERQLISERHTHKMKQAALAGRLKRSNETLRQTEQQLEETRLTKNAANDGKSLNSNMAAYKASPICRHIIEVVDDSNFKPKIEPFIYKKFALDRNQLNALVEAADLNLDNFTVRIRKKYPALNEEDMKYCCLYLLGLNEADISALMQRAYSTVCDRNRKIKRIIGTEGELKVALMDWV